MKNFKDKKKNGLFKKKSYYSALAVCLVMLGLGCFASYRKTSQKLTEDLSSVTEQYKKPSVTVSPYEKDVVDAAKNKHGIKKETTATTVTQPAETTVSEKKVTEKKDEKQPETRSVSRKYSIPINGEIIQEFSGDNLVKNNTTGVWQTHNGVDIAGSSGDEVRAMAAGTVIDIHDDPLWGTVVTIDHGDGINARYCGLNKGLNVENGGTVSAQDVIGAIGDTADIESSMESHLHLEVLRNGEYVNPIDVINNN